MADRMYHSLTWPDWQRQLDSLARDCAAADAADQAWHLRAFQRLLQSAPALAPLDGIASPGPASLEAMLGCGACESAAMAFIDPRAGCMVSRGADGFHLASIVLPGPDTEASASGATLALAVLAALSAAIGNRTATPRLASRHDHQASPTVH